MAQRLTQQGTGLAFIGTLFMPNLRIDDKPAVEPVAEAASAEGSATAATLTASVTSAHNNAALKENENGRTYEPAIVEQD
jgi:hypothetical protein